MLNPLYILGPPLLLLISIPLAFFAALTTFLAFSTLLARVSIVYFELGLALLHSALFLGPPKPTTTAITNNRHPLPLINSLSGSKSPRQPSLHRPHRRRSSVSPAPAHPQSKPKSQSKSKTSSPPTPNHRAPPKSSSFASLISTSAARAARDFEGVGGWRDASSFADDAVWLGMNARLELPAAVPVGGGSPHGHTFNGSHSPGRQRHHQRAHTGPGGRFSRSPEAMRMSMSPVAGRVRTPSASAGDKGAGGEEGGNSPDEYFSMQMYRRLGGSVGELPMRGEERRRTSEAGSCSTCSSTSTSSGKGGRVGSASKGVYA